MRLKLQTKRDVVRVRAVIAVFLMPVVVATVLAAGCAAGKGVMPQAGGISVDERIAVIPLENYTSDQFAHEKVRRALISELVSRGIDVIEPGEVARAMAELKLRYQGPVNINDIKALGLELHVSKLILGSVSTYGINRGMTVSYPEVSVNLMLVETESGSILRSVSHTAGGADFWTKHFGMEGKTLSEIETLAVAGSVDLLFEK